MEWCTENRVPTPLEMLLLAKPKLDCSSSNSDVQICGNKENRISPEATLTGSALDLLMFEGYTIDSETTDMDAPLSMIVSTA